LSELSITINPESRARYFAGTFGVLIGAGLAWGQTASHSLPGALAGYFVLIAAALVLTYREFVEIDTDENRIDCRIGFLFPIPFVRTRFDTRGIRRITFCRVVIRSSGKNKRRRVTYGVRINNDSGAKLCTHDDFWAARHAAERICRALGVDFETDLFGASSVRTAAELDLKLAERWQRAGKLKEAPRVESSAQMIVKHEEDASLLSMPVQPAPRLAAGIGLAALLAALCAVGVFVDGAGLFLFGCGVMASFVLGTMILQHSGRNRIRFTATSVEVRYGLLPIRQHMAIDDIEELLDNGEDIALLGDRGYVLVEKPPDPVDREILRQFIERQIARRQRLS
jgi:hypothetical protein